MSVNTEGLLFNSTRILKNGNNFLGVNYRGTASILGSSYKTLKVPIRIYADADHSTVYRQEWTVENLAFPLDQGRNIDLDSMTDSQKNLHLWFTMSGENINWQYTPTNWNDIFNPTFDDDDVNSRRAAARSICVNGKYYYNDCAIEVIDEMIKDTGWRIPLPDQYLYLVNYFENLQHMKASVKYPPIYYPDPANPSVVQYFCSEFNLDADGVDLITLSSTNLRYDQVPRFRTLTPKQTTLSSSGNLDDSRVLYVQSEAAITFDDRGGVEMLRDPEGHLYTSGSIDLAPSIRSAIGNYWGVGLPTRGIVNVPYPYQDSYLRAKCRVTFRADGYDGKIADPTVRPPQMLYNWLNYRHAGTPAFYPIRLVRLNNYNL